MKKRLVKPVIRNIRKKTEFEKFIEILETSTVIAHWVEIAEILGVNKDTINEWRKLPEARQARARGIAAALSKMQRAGAKDWRMWEAKLRMLGFGKENQSSHQADNIQITFGADNLSEGNKHLLNTWPELSK